ncbi:MAG: energy transducer TonB [Saprospiraceae bacterium]
MRQDDVRFLDLLQRWQSGDFTRADERELMSLAESDVFRREAMEGFMAFPDADHDAQLQALYRRLRMRGDGSQPQIVGLPRWWAAAAAVLLLLVAVWFFPVTKNEKAPVAQTAEKTADEPDNSAAQPESELSGSDYAAAEDPAEAKKIISPGSGNGAAMSKSAPANRSAPAGGMAAAEESDVLADNMSSEAAPPPALPQFSPSKDEVAGAPPRPQTTMKPTKEMPAASVPVVADKSNAKAKKQLPPVRTTDSTWHQTDLKPDMEAERAQARESGQPAVSEPAGGWDAFKEYLRHNARLTADARDHNVSGFVQVQFIVNANSEPQNFVILRSLGHGCDEEAIRLVKSWEWVPGKNPATTADIWFVR